MSVQQIRTSLDKLVSTQEVTKKPQASYTIIKLNKYDEYQTSNTQDNKPITNEQQASNKPVTTTNNINNINKENKNKRNNWYNTKRKNNLIFKLKTNLSSLIRISIKRNGFTKKSKTNQILGCTFEEFKLHLESKFEPWMTWDNYGEWHVDHKIPMSSFLFESVDDIGFKECWKLENLQPLWALDNLSKGDKILI